MATRVYDVNLVTLVFGGIPIQEFADGDAMVAEYDDDDFVTSQGSHGSVMRAKKHNNLVTLTIRLMQGSPSNSYLSSINTADRTGGTGVRTCQMKDLLGADLLVAPFAWVMKPANMGMATEPGEREWVIKLSNATMTHGENVVPAVA